jgi:hypothetical protein
MLATSLRAVFLQMEKGKGKRLRFGRLPLFLGRFVSVNAAGVLSGAQVKTVEKLRRRKRDP